MINVETYAGKSSIAAWLENRGIRVERDGNKLYGLLPSFELQDEDGYSSITYQRFEMRTMEDARTLNRKVHS